MKTIDQVLYDYKQNLKAIENLDLSKMKNLKAGMDLSRQTVLTFRNLVRDQNYFKNAEDEIHFFKDIKPFVIGRLRFFGELQKFRLKWPKADSKCQKKYVRASLRNLHDFRNENKIFWRYIKDKETRKDRLYFLRGNCQLGINCDLSQYDVDPEFSTGYDILMAHFVATDLLTKYYKELLFKLENRVAMAQPDLLLNKHRRWSGSKTDLVELLYAFQALGVINNGEAEISKMVKVTEILLNIKLGNPYKTFAEIKAREKDQTKFLDSLKQALLTKIQMEDAFK